MKLLGDIVTICAGVLLVAFLLQTRGETFSLVGGAALLFAVLGFILRGNSE